MSADDGFVDRALHSFVTRLGGYGVLVVAAFLYAGIGLALPLALGLSIPWLVLVNVLATTFAGLLILIELAHLMEAGRRRNLLEWTTDLRLLTSEEFEWLVGEMFRREGWTVRETGRNDEADGNIDLDLMRDGQRAIVQCKRWQSWPVGVDQIRAFGGTLLREGLPGAAGLFVTLSTFGEKAREEAREMGLVLIDNRELYSRIEKLRRPELCAVCESAMVLSRSTRGWWFRCVSAGCHGKRDLGRDPGRAIELLVE